MDIEARPAVKDPKSFFSCVSTKASPSGENAPAAKMFFFSCVGTLVACAATRTFTFDDNNLVAIRLC